MNLNIDTLKQCVESIPPLPSSIQKAQAILDSDNINMQDLEEVVSSDIALTTKVLKIANSPFYGMARQLASIREASIVLGVHTLRSLIVACGAMGQFPAQGGNAIDRNKLWEHALATGIFAKQIASHLRINADYAFTAGLLHDIGKLILDEHFPDETKKIIHLKDSKGCRFIDAEKKLTGITHCAIGAKLLEHWLLPETITSVVDKHHTPESLNEKDITGIVAMANILCHKASIGNSESQLQPDQLVQVNKQLGLSDDELMEFIETATKNFNSSKTTLLS